MEEVRNAFLNNRPNCSRRALVLGFRCSTHMSERSTRRLLNQHVNYPAAWNNATRFLLFLFIGMQERRRITAFGSQGFPSIKFILDQFGELCGGLLLSLASGFELCAGVRNPRLELVPCLE